MSLSLWLVPPVTLRAEIATIIDNYAEQLSTPRFIPHLTLLTGVDDASEAQLRRLAGACLGVMVEPEGIATGHDFYHCVFLAVNPTPELRRVRAAAERIFSAKNAEPFRPHMSLVYGDLPGETRDAVAREIEATRFVPFAPEVLEAVQTEGTPERWPSKVQIALR